MLVILKADLVFLVKSAPTCLVKQFVKGDAIRVRDEVLKLLLSKELGTVFIFRTEMKV